MTVLILGIVFLVSLCPVGASSQIDDAESLVVDMLDAEANFPSRYAVECVFEAQIPETEGLGTCYCKQWLARDTKLGLIRVVAEQEMLLDFALLERERVVMWIKGTEAWSYSPFDSWVNDGGTVLPIFDPKNVSFSSVDLVGRSLHEDSITKVLSNRECVESQSEQGFLLSKWAFRECSGVNRITVLKSRLGTKGPPEQVLLLPAIKGGWTKDKEPDNVKKGYFSSRSTTEWHQAGENVWVPLKTVLVSKLNGREAEGTFTMKWALGAAIPDAVFKDPRNAEPDDVFRGIRFDKKPKWRP